MFKKFRDGLKKTTPTFHRVFGRVGGAFTGRVLGEEAIEELEEAFYGADFGVETTEEIIGDIQAAYKENRELKGEEAARIAADVVRRALAGSEVFFQPEWDPEVICLIGVNGAGKTTTAAKLCRHYMDWEMKTVLGACDTFRAAANEQLKSWAERLDLDIVTSHHGADSAAVAYDTYVAALHRECQLAILDTAGRLHTKSHLMNELRKIKKALQKHDETAPHHRWLVVDGSLGSNSIEQARAFHKEFDLTGIIVTKLDGTSRGGALVGIYRELKLPIYYVGFGEQPEDLQPFSIEHYVNSIFGFYTDPVDTENV